MSCSSLVSLRAVYRDCLVRVEPLFRHCDDGLRIRRARIPPITASPMLRVSKRLTANVFREPEVEQGPAQLMPPTPKLPAYYVGCQVEGTSFGADFAVSMGPPVCR